MFKKGHKIMSKTETISVEQDTIDKQLVSLIDKNIVEIRKAENSTSTINLMGYISENVFPKFKNKDKDKEIKSVRKYILASYPFDDTLGITRNAYDTMNSRISRGGQLVFHKRITITGDKLKDKKGNRLIISKVEDMHNKFINKPTKDTKIEIETADVSVPTVEESNHKPKQDYVEITSTDEKIEETISYLISLTNLTEGDFDTLLSDRNLQEFIQENAKPIEHRLSKLLKLAKSKAKKVA
jgi:hypothetical protein|tara:strand:+ start:424 stop:1146 length:723 start_codon:yes stop_codon:yes gene_type:complete